MASFSNILGIDVGSVSIHIIVLTQKGDIVHTDTCCHHGEVKQCLSNLIRRIDLRDINYAAATDATPSFIKTQRFYDEHMTIIRAARYYNKIFDAILHIGGEKFSLSRFDLRQNYIGTKHNTSCAAGTGSFLDQQARRLNLLGGSCELSIKALSNIKKIPDIATRCAVFAKTDLIHAQQEGYSIEQICDGLCYGLAKNISNTIFKYKHFEEKIIFCGGVSKNISVKKHLEKITGYNFIIDSNSIFYGATGAALCLLDEIISNKKIDKTNFLSTKDFFISATKENLLSYPGLDLKLSEFPDFSCFSSYEIEDVEADIYQNPATVSITKGYLGIDVGSTSTKSILINQDGIPIAGFYTKTASRPVKAIQKIFKAHDQFFNSYGIKIKINGCGTTGSGRRISGKIIGADIEPDEITAHATAAVNLNNDVDTIIEIGGQDAKFTLLKDGMVTSSVMNTVCAAGTGSFIEEQALKLDCPLPEYSERTQGVSSPVASDRCTVFMERDINYYFAQGYEKNEILASVLHSVRDNYLTKVANIGKIGNCILFQGATAKNKALVAAFEQKLKKPIHVSKYCHLTGALGVALLLKEKQTQSSNFRGFDLWKQEIPVRMETCDLCTNHCKLTIADIKGKTIAYGFLCGRDYQTNKVIPKKNTYNLLKIRKFALPKTEERTIKHNFTIGIPNALHLYEDNYFWIHFFSRLGIKTKTSSNLKNPVKLGKTIARAEFCAPVVSLHGNIKYLMDKVDYLFLPFYFEERPKEENKRRQHCYYTQFAPSIISCLTDIDEKRIISPIIKYLYTNFHTKLELYKSLKKISSDFLFSFFDISAAYDSALEFKKNTQINWKTLYPKYKSKGSNINILLLGRPYTVLTENMNNNIPQLFENLGVKTFFQDMLDFDTWDFSQINPLLKEIHWKYAAQILKATYIAASSDHLYPVYISSFKCSPDSFAIDYFKQIMENFHKPYLVLDLDEHDSSVGYETRIEAAVQSFQNHNATISKEKSVDLSCLHPKFLSKLKNKTIIYPNWDSYSGSLIVSVLRNEGFNALLMEETPETLKKSILTNTGQCIPLNALAAGFIHTIEKNNLDPSNCVLWLNSSDIACNIKMYPYHIKKILEKNGNGFEKSGIYKGQLSLFDISYRASTNAYFAYMFGGLLRNIGCKIRPYEIQKGRTDRSLLKALKILCNAFENSESKEEALKNAIEIFSDIETKKESRPKVGIFGDLYVRDNDIMNQGLVHFIENNGGEVITTSYYKYAKIIANSYFKKWFKEGKYLSLFSNGALLVAMQVMEKKYYKYFEPILNTSAFKVKDSYENILSEYGILKEHTGESMDNILKIHHIINEHPDIRLLVQTNPAFCCPGLITEAMAQKLEEKINVPIVSITYDVSGGNKNKVILPFLMDSGVKQYSCAQKVPI
ncbi:MAG: CoA activase [Desulfobacula sp.]|jgi:predicted CoA-substrate-specific enzyme activase|uniref:acyl-CoA dehydratase activase n=1 Tax=Desulfobacula sp. TaxID=2593537 RepID=UPI001D91A15D|nr:CoA activase [Desulfobacula sp.]MBT3484404.1 CoA activase [Desulfobacula sp.]MBT3803319.1 CoA activase [Desulfobacula sp.]MBT4023715.1 CoA activase [Desulfobacula sp.]MBT4197957.1 CoA activase [Desulfobacula sp.]